MRSVRFTRWPPRTPARVVTIWANYGPHHLARMEALEDRGCEVMGFSWCASDDNYPFFNLAPARHEVINHCELASVQTVTSFRRCLGLLWRYRPDIVLTCG